MLYFVKDYAGGWVGRRKLLHQGLLGTQVRAAFFLVHAPHQFGGTEHPSTKPNHFSTAVGRRGILTSMAIKELDLKVLQFWVVKV